MLRSLSIRKKLIFGMILGCLVPYFMGGYYIKTATEKWLYENNLEYSNRMLIQTAKHVDDTILTNMKNLISMVSIDPRIMNPGDEVNNYTQYNPSNFVKKYSLLENEIAAYLETIKKTQPYLTLVSYGTESGGYIEIPEFKPSAPYDPRVRPWYQNSISTHDPVLSEPYITKVSKELVFAVTKSVLKDNQKIGVVSITIKLQTLMAEINSLKNGSTGYINILSSKNVFLNSPENPDWVMKSVEDVNLEIFKDFEKYNGSYYEGQINGVDKVLNVYISPYSGWKYISVIDKSEVLAQSQRLTLILFSIYLLAFILFLLVILAISNYITEPILAIAESIKQMATFKFDLLENKHLEDYSHHNDEIGEITRAMNTMQSNFMELQSNIVLMDEQIQNIDIDASKAYQMALSTNNPFSGIIDSVNALLLRVHSSITQVKKYNDEIINKNELLVASEEELIAQLEEIEDQKEYINFLANHDPLTNLPNRRKFHEELERLLQSDKRGAVVLLDLDNFKAINDTLGHMFGDKVLQHISDQLQRFATEKVFVSRFGGDEFLLLFECENDINEAESYVSDIQQYFSNSFTIDQNDVKTEFSIGISIFPDDSTDIDQLIMNADLALYTIKNTGKNNFAYFGEEMAAVLKTKQGIKDLLRDALAHDGFKMVYQPIVQLISGEVISYEALLRLKHHPISPALFIGIAEEEGMIIGIGRLVTQMVIEQMAKWREQGLTLRPVSINFSAVQIHDYQYKSFLLEQLNIYDIDPTLIIIELTENVFLENKETTMNLMNDLRSHGIQISIDDFGTGYSSLSYLANLPIDSVKLDRALCLKFLEFENNDVMDSLISLAHSLNLKVVAEGIEDSEHVRRLKNGQCDTIQGFYFSKPLEADMVLQRGHERY